MSEPKKCCQDLSRNLSSSPFDEEIAWGYYDGPTNGIVHCQVCDREYYFAMIDSRSNHEDLDIRIFELASIPDGSVAKFRLAMSVYDEPKKPIWVPLWSFPTEQDQIRMNNLVDGIINAKGVAEWVVATDSWLSCELLAALPNRSDDVLQPEDWFEAMGLIEATVDE